MTKPNIDYTAITETLSGETPVKIVGEPLHGEAAASAGRELLRKYGSDNAISQAIRLGRPRVGDAKRGPSPTVRGRIAEEDFAALVQLEAQSGKSQSALVREAIQLLLERHRLAS
ncbi:hypothetical protein FQ154_11185 [Paeniglutamicibacter gangotriensis]|uniref:Ribbon-helix-helix protein, CopG family n=1 Tax=Paeniglutamicibacter gangotriensis TaxID=254787 RepID=A0A5B0EC45_9MICC|nr:hypothetical protein [Paeniglutamicibacter gangotriensis]KAA0976423.1 hypothetical protein FQ154_11185 [Paeniglutamicibacter gangotriensis]